MRERNEKAMKGRRGERKWEGCEWCGEEGDGRGGRGRNDKGVWCSGVMRVERVYKYGEGRGRM